MKQINKYQTKTMVNTIIYEYKSNKKLLIINKIQCINKQKKYEYPWQKYSKDVIKITLADNITHIPQNAFANFSNLTSVDLPNSVTSIEDKAFANCYHLLEITIPDNCNVAPNAFQNCFLLELVNYLKGIFGFINTSDKIIRLLIENIGYHLKYLDAYDKTGKYHRIEDIFASFKQIYDRMKLRGNFVLLMKRFVSLVVPVSYRLESSNVEWNFNSIYKEINKNNIEGRITTIQSIFDSNSFRN